MNNTDKLLRAFIEASGYEIETVCDYKERDMSEVEAQAHNKGFGCATGYRLLTESGSQKLLIDDDGNYKGVLIEPIVDYKVTKKVVESNEHQVIFDTQSPEWSCIVKYITDHVDDIESNINDFDTLKPMLDYFNRNS
mgnify:CR=1 FL=1|tara:strand:- start:5345 stop:5755 length:411 start_codon:yes stop_codon:yes gene_type:complete